MSSSSSKSLPHEEHPITQITLKDPHKRLQDTLEKLIYSTELNSSERRWRDRYFFFLERGYELRSRYRPDWTASATGASSFPSHLEDRIEQLLPMVLDAKRIRDSTRVCLKLIEKRTQEVEIGRFLSSKHLRVHNNHCVPVWDSFQDPFSPEVDYIVMPILRPFDEPAFGAVGEVVDFVTQLLEGLDFLHSHHIAHGDLAAANIMIDAKPIIPGGWHFVLDSCAPNGYDLLSPLARIDHPVRYYMVDFGLALRFRPEDSHLIDGLGGRDPDPPELKYSDPYDAFKLDVFTLGNVFFQEFQQKYVELKFLSGLTSSMMQEHFDDRPTARMALQQWYAIQKCLDSGSARWRLSKPDESIAERIVYNTVAVAQQGMRSLKIMFKGNSHNP